MRRQFKGKKLEHGDSAPDEGAAILSKHKLPHPTEERIRQRASEIYKGRGGSPGRELDDWLQAEREMKAEVDQALDAQAANLLQLNKYEKS